MKDILQFIASIKGSPIVWPQAIHFLIGYAVLLTVYREGLRKNYWFIGVLVFLGAFAIEVWYDPKYEHDPFLWGGVKDLVFYVAGAVFGVIVDYGWILYRFDRNMRRLPSR